MRSARAGSGRRVAGLSRFRSAARTSCFGKRSQSRKRTRTVSSFGETDSSFTTLASGSLSQSQSIVKLRNSLRMQ